MLMHYDERVCLGGAVVLQLVYLERIAVFLWHASGSVLWHEGCLTCFRYAKKINRKNYR